MATKLSWLEILLISGGGYVAWKWYQNKTAASGPPGSPSAVPGMTAVLPAIPAPGGQVYNGQVLAPVPGQNLPVATVAPGVPAGIDPTVYSIVQSWAIDDNRAPVLRMAAAAIPAEYAGMYDIITNYWDKNIPVGISQTTFWNNLRGKYDPGDPIW
jgi:hypothetical protein